MKLEAENSHVIIDVDQAQLVSTLKSLKSYGPSSYACLTDDDGNYVQVAGGRFTCFIEMYDAKSKTLFRGCHSNSSTNFEDGSWLSFGAGRVQLKKDEWFNIDDVIEIFSRFHQARPLPESAYWREVKVLDRNDS
ncbi:hypothetical protein G7011_14950 [Pseudomonas plecoglossicida]|uniref:hypothetical protein n=1 Tax=Pseudomonas plecoglossicida TaxID=70775 RepID=UPI0015E43076|nr:hypothetical protein [Pseudomonas plecoglossicida]MBA1198410.1 hypothetical protein [Pseudomonas plecoglossicida]